MNPAVLFSYKAKSPVFSRGVYIAPSAVVIGDVTVGADTGIWFGCLVRGDVNSISIGERCNIQDGTLIHVTRERYPTLLEDDVSIAHGVMLHGCVLRRGSFVGMRATVMDGCEIGEGAFVAAGSLLPPGKLIPPGMLAMGFPAKVVREVRDSEIEMMKRTVLNYVLLKNEYLSNDVVSEIRD